MTDCIHGLDIALCDACTPQQAPESARPAMPRRTAGTRPPTAAPARPGVKVNQAEQRRYLVVARSRLVEALTGLDGEDGWRLELGTAFDPFRWRDAGDVERASDLVVLVAASPAPGELRLVAVANEPVRRSVRDELDSVAVDTRVVLQPSWF